MRLISIGGFCWGKLRGIGDSEKVLCQLQTMGTPFNAVSLGRIIGTETKYFPGKSNCSYTFPLICRVFSGSGILQITVG